MTDLARSRGDQLIDLLGEYTEADDRPEPGYRQRPDPDWLSEFADEEKPRPRDTPRGPGTSVAELLLSDPPAPIQAEAERTTGQTSSRFATLAVMALLAVISTSIVFITAVLHRGDLPDVHNPAPALLALPRIPSAPAPDAVPSAPGEAAARAISRDPGPSPRQRVRETYQAQPTSLPISGSSSREVETAAVQDVLERYRASSAGLEFQSCGVELFEGGRATARCRGRSVFTPKGTRSERVQLRAWSFQLSHVNDVWTIVSVDSR